MLPTSMCVNLYYFIFYCTFYNGAIKMVVFSEGAVRVELLHYANSILSF